MARKITTVTHPDGTVSKRTSEKATYLFAVVAAESTEQLALEQEAHAARIRVEIANRQAALANGEVTSERRPWSWGGSYVTVYVGGEYATGGVECEAEGRVAPTADEARAALSAKITADMTSAAWYDERAAELRASGAMRYRVVRWSAKAANAHTAARGEFASINRPGCSVSVVGVDE